MPIVKNKNSPQKSKPVSENSETQDEEIFIPEEPKYTLDDIILSDAVKAQILDVATYVENS